MAGLDFQIGNCMMMYVCMVIFGVCVCMSMYVCMYVCVHFKKEIKVG